MVNWRGITAIETSGRWDLNKTGEDAAKIGGLFTPISVLQQYKCLIHVIQR